MRNEIEIKKSVLAVGADAGTRSSSSFRKLFFNPMICSILASLGIFGGISSLFAGLLCIVVHVAIHGDTIFDRAGTALLIAGIPMLLVGSIFLDEIEGKK